MQPADTTPPPPPYFDVDMTYILHMNTSYSGNCSTNNCTCILYCNINCESHI